MDELMIKRFFEITVLASLFRLEECWLMAKPTIEDNEGDPAPTINLWAVNSVSPKTMRRMFRKTTIYYI
jgi:hypothetical protein